ncbi:hypothetical protein [uncultured Corynebacterium sp.]|uniref:hypothetical protein n=1 Tax=uncultured Corynebacterium sp. TaxID=159447 RepID=UPI0025FF4737|nr:hypothetical protein [uncultured Corynebacterium sp.]
MATVVLACGTLPPTLAEAAPDAVRLADVPGRRELKLLDALASAHLPVDPTPSLDEIAAQPDVPHQADPRPAPQTPDEPVRVVVIGSDAALAAVVTRLMRIDALWISVGYVPVDTAGRKSLTAHVWGLDAEQLPASAALDHALTGTPQPTALIRDDAGIATLGCAEIFHAGTTMVGEVIVDSETLFLNDTETAWNGRPGPYGARFVPTTGTPGLAATRLTTPSLWDEAAAAHPPKKPLFGLLGGGAVPGGVDPEVVLTGRALQAGGESLTVVRDGVTHPRTVGSVTFYRHLRDGQFVRR